MNNCILLVSDQEYLKYFYPLAFSIQKYVDSVDVHMHLINVQPSDRKFIEDTFSATVTFEELSLSPNKIKPSKYGELPLLNDHLISDKHAYCNNKRYELIPRLLQDGYDNVLYMDVDNLIRGNVDELFEIINSHDVTIHKYPHGIHPLAWRKFMTYCCGIIGVHNSDMSKKFFDDIKERVEREGVFEIGDQLYFYETLSHYKQSLKLGQIPQNFKDDHFEESSQIWTGDGNKKLTYTFLGETKQYDKYLVTI